MKRRNRSHSQFLPQNHNRKAGGFWVPLAFAVLAIAFVSFVAIHSKSGNVAVAAPFAPACEPHGYLFQYQGQPPTSVQSVDLVTNSLNSVGSIPSRTVNGTGYNVQDNFMYGWDNRASPRTLVRIHGDLTTTDQLTVSGLPAGIAPVNSGDMDLGGQYWFVSGGAGVGEWHHIDLSSGTPTYVSGGAAYGATGPPTTLPDDASIVPDLAYVPPTPLNGSREGMYTIVKDGADVPQLYRMDISTGTPQWQLIGSLGAFMTSAEGVTGALYADALGVLYAGSNTGQLWRILIGDGGSIQLTAIKIGDGSAVHNNDGARCAQAYPPADFSDAPLSYSTRWEDFGPLHAVGNFDDENSEASLMLGKKIDIEGLASDGFPDAAADGDDQNHTNTSPFVDDEDGVQHIVATPGTPTPLAVPVTVTNNSSSPATLAGWIDLNGSGTFEEDERVTKDIPANSGKGVYELTFPEATFNANTYARFRLFQGTGLDNSVLQPHGLGSAFKIGEVEDYEVQVGSFNVNKTANPPADSDVSPGETLTYTLDITNTGATDLANLTIHDDLSDVLDDATPEGNPAVDPSAAGTATITGNTLEFKGDISTGQTVTVTYSVKVNDPDNLGNHEIRNHVIAANSNCHPSIENNQHAAPGDPACQTLHKVPGLANTGSSVVLPIALSGALLVTAGASFIIMQRQNRIRLFNRNERLD